MFWYFINICLLKLQKSESLLKELYQTHAKEHSQQTFFLEKQVLAKVRLQVWSQADLDYSRLELPILEQQHLVPGYQVLLFKVIIVSSLKVNLNLWKILKTFHRYQD